MNKLKVGWFSDVCGLWPGTCVSYEIDFILYEEKSKFQNILVLQTKHHGRLFVLDGILQIMETDGFAYNEMITFLPLCSHPNPKKVLIIGGGTGGGVKQVIKHPTVELVDLVELDGRVIEICKQFFPDSTVGYDDPRVNIHIEDGVKFLEQCKNKYDVIINDASDPVGPSAPLYKEEYFQLLKKALLPGGVICTQVGSLWLYSAYTENFNVPLATYNCCKKVFGNAIYAYSSVPSFGGQTGFIVACTDLERNLKEPCFVLPESTLKDKNIRYYSPSMHSAASVLPYCHQKLFG